MLTVSVACLFPHCRAWHELLAIVVLEIVIYGEENAVSKHIGCVLVILLVNNAADIIYGVGEEPTSWRHKLSRCESAFSHNRGQRRMLWDIV